MIESRYSIEYIDPSSDNSSSMLGKFFVYSTLTISILAAIIALIYSNLPNSTSQVVTDKVQQFISSFNEPSTNTFVEEEIIVSEPETPIKTIEAKSTQVNNNKEELAQQKLIAIQLEDEYKKEIERLSQENTTQHNETVKQLTENQTLTKKLDVLSKELKNEIQKSALLKKEVTSLQTENKTVSALLIKTEVTAKNYANEIKKLEQKEIKVVAPPVIFKSVTPEPIEIKKVKAEVVSINETSKPTEDPSTSNKNEAPVSQMDAIVAAMEDANSTSNNQNAEASSSTKK